MSQVSKIQNYTTLDNYRYERKFAVSNLSFQGIDTVIKNHSAYFKDLFFPRYINNIYFDTQNLTCYSDNAVGKAHRRKYRIRWYNELFGEVKTPVLEIKIKKALLGTKKSFPLIPFKIDKGFTAEDMKNVISNSNLPGWVVEDMRALYPTLLNRYKRKYYRDFSKNFRITVDTEIEYYRIANRNNSFFDNIKDSKNIVVELKYDDNHNENASYISSKFPFRMTKNSKYVNGIDYLWSPAQ